MKTAAPPCTLEDFSLVVEILEKNLRYVEGLGMDATTIHVYKRVISHLKSREANEIERILGIHTAEANKRLASSSESILNDKKISELRIDQIKAFLKNSKTSRAYLERIATIRFGVTRGALSALRSREALSEKLLNMIENESTHEAIVRAAATQQPK